MLAHVWLVPALPLAGFLVNGLFGRRLGKDFVSVIGPGSVGTAFVLAVVTFFQLRGLPAHERLVELDLFQWMPVGDLHVTAGLQVDPLSVVMMLVVTGVGFLIHVYSVGYMHEDGSFWRFFAYLNLFTFAMLVLVLASSFPLLFVGWEGVGLCSYLLIGFWYEDRINTDAGKKAFVVNRVGDFAFLVGMFLIFRELGTLDFTDAFAAAPHRLAMGSPAAFWIALLLFIGATGKSAQLPLHIWLPDAMQGPTPVSALIHAATMVTAGVYMVARAHVLYLLAPAALGIVAVVGAATAVFAATIALVQTDIKRVLAYSTISQLGYMFLGVGLAAFTAGIFHLVTHAFFKALLFLGAGSVIHALHHEQDLRRMGGLKDKLPLTFQSMLVATLAIAGIPPLAGFFSKDEILWRTFDGGQRLLWAVGLFTAGLTAVYMFRMLYLAFYGPPRDRQLHAHAYESPPSMTGPLVILAVLSVVGGWIGVPASISGPLSQGQVVNLLERWLQPVFADGARLHAKAAAETSHLAAEYGLMAASVAVAFAGMGLASYFYRRHPGLSGRVSESFPRLDRLFVRKWYVDEIYGVLVVRPYLALCALAWRVVDDVLIDGFVVELVGGAVRFYSRAVSRLQTGLVSNYATALFVGALVLLGWWLLR